MTSMSRIPQDYGGHAPPVIKEGIPRSQINLLLFFVCFKQEGGSKLKKITVTNTLFRFSRTEVIRALFVCFICRGLGLVCATRWQPIRPCRARLALFSSPWLIRRGTAVWMALQDNDSLWWRGSYRSTSHDRMWWTKAYADVYPTSVSLASVTNQTPR